MKLFSLLPKRLIHLACNSPAKPGGEAGDGRIFARAAVSLRNPVVTASGLEYSAGIFSRAMT